MILVYFDADQNLANEEVSVCVRFFFYIFFYNPKRREERYRALDDFVFNQS